MSSSRACAVPYYVQSLTWLLVKVEGSFAPALEDETETIEHLLAEPKSEYVTEISQVPGEHLMYIIMNSFDVWIAFCSSSGRYDELEFGVLDGLLDEVDEVEDIHAINGLASPCDDYLLDIGFTGKASELGFGPCEKSHLGNSSSESQSPRLSGSSNGAVGISESSTVTIQEFECKNNSIDKAVTHEFHGGFRRKKRHRTPVEGNVYPASINLQNLELDNDEKSLVREIVSGENEKLSVEATKLGKKSKDSNERENCSPVTATQDRSKVRCQNEHHHMSPGILSSVPEEDSISENQTLAEFRTQRKLAKKHASILALESDEQPITSESEDDHVPKKDLESTIEGSIKGCGLSLR
ncbi:TRF-like 8 [Prunus dulcis]|uniref:TRF-like 8 n=1 Tax=Prunus dulcis TaxID=3755 RepID=A0A4Y1RPF9_PRUDU|nr:TRF-like 8 [Prunus dulcis]